MSAHDRAALKLHKKHKGKLEIRSLVSLKNKKDLAIAYTPGVAAVSRAIVKNKKRTRELTMSGRTVAVVTDGSAVLGLGNIGPEAALPVMEGKAVLFKHLAGLDAIPVVLSVHSADEIVAVVKAIAPGFAAVNLEDIAAPLCFEIEERLTEELSIPVMHDDQHGTAIVVLAALINAAKVARKQLKNLHIVINGAGAAAIATAALLGEGGVDSKKILMLDSNGILSRTREKLSPHKKNIARTTNGKDVSGDLARAVTGADVFIGMSKGGVFDKKLVSLMAERPIIFAMANPEPEISYRDAVKTKAVVVGTGRSDYPNQINNALAFPGVFKGAIHARAHGITTRMKLAAASAIVRCVSKQRILKGIVVPDVLDVRVHEAVAKAVARAAKKR